MTERDTTAFAWLIEAGPEPHYWDGRGVDSSTTDHAEAVRFSRFEDAERVRCWLIEGGEHWRSVEHGWSPAAMTKLSDDTSAEEYRLGKAASPKRIVREDTAMLLASLEGKLSDAQARIEQACFWSVQNATDGTIVGSFESLAKILKGEPQ